LLVSVFREPLDAASPEVAVGQSFTAPGRVGLPLMYAPDCRALLAAGVGHRTFPASDGRTAAFGLTLRFDPLFPAVGVGQDEDPLAEVGRARVGRS
jgi:hypothetical protein